MTPEELELVGSSTSAVLADRDGFARRFYERLFAIAPETRSLFPDDMAVQRGKLVDEFEFLAGAATDLDRFVTRARELGRRHADYGVAPDHYDLLERALFDALADALGDDWTPDHRVAWERLYRLIAETMMDGAAGHAFAPR